MIRVEPQPEPPDFEDRVRQPGLQALAENPTSMPPYWRRCLGDLYVAYSGICAYACIYIDRVTGGRTVDHFVAKSSDPTVAYEWSNYRLACSLVNSRKGAFDDVLDPFEIADGWFVLEFSFLQIYPCPDLDRALQQKVQETIDRLRLGDKEFLDARAAYYDDYIGGHIDLAYLELKCPFVAKEVRRQGLVRPEDL